MPHDFPLKNTSKILLLLQVWGIKFSKFTKIVGEARETIGEYLTKSLNNGE